MSEANQSSNPPLDCTAIGCEVRVFDILASLYKAAFLYEYDGVHNGRPQDGGGTIDDTVIGAAFTDTFSLEQMIADICYIYRIERQYKADGVYFYRNAGLDEPNTIAATIDSSELAVSEAMSSGVQFAIATTYLDSSNA